MAFQDDRIPARILDLFHAVEDAHSKAFNEYLDGADEYRDEHLIESSDEATSELWRPSEERG